MSVDNAENKTDIVEIKIIFIKHAAGTNDCIIDPIDE